jgi:uncharacterized protein (DUF302 family)
MKAINFKREVAGDVEGTVARLTEALQAEGFGVLTRIDLHTKIKEKLGKELRPAVILGACNPQLAYEAYQQNTDVASLLPCNAVVRDVGGGRVSVELVKPTAMMEILGEPRLVGLAHTADLKLKSALERLPERAELAKPQPAR